MKRKILTISLLIITLSAFMTLTNCGKKEDPAPIIPCTPPDAPTVKLTINVDAGQTVNLTAGFVADAIYKWTGPNNYTSTEQNPTITATTENMTGEYKCTVTVLGCTSDPATTFVLIKGVLLVNRQDDENSYKTIKIGKQTWMAENLKWKPADKQDSWKEYGDKPNIGLIYGTLYNYNLAKLAAGGIPGWRLPTDDDWKTLINYLDSAMHAGAKLKEAAGVSSPHWTPPNSQATNTSGFTAIGAGYYDVINGLGFQDINNRTYFWSSTLYSQFLIIYRLQTENSWVDRVYGAKENFYSIRLVKI